MLVRPHRAPAKQSCSDEAERSVRAGLDIVDAMAELNAALPRPAGVELAVRIGVASGPVIVGDQIGEGTASETAVVGETPNLAARLQALAQPNQIVVSAATRAMLGDHFVEDLGTSELKRFAEPVPAWRVLSARDVESRFAATRTGSSAPLVGRQEEMGLQLRAWEGSSQGRGQVVLIQGEAGVGKSRLAMRAFAILGDLAQGRLADIEIGIALEMIGGDLELRHGRIPRRWRE